MWATILAALIPVGVEGLKQATTRFLGGVRATSVEEQIKFDQNEIERLKALAALDVPIGQPSQWVVDLRASARYVAAMVVIVGGLALLWVPNVPGAIQAVGMEAANIAFGFLFGARIVSAFKTR